MTAPPSIRVLWPDGTMDLAGAETPGLPATHLAARLSRAGRGLNMRCGGRRLCAGCTVRIVSGTFRHRSGAMITAPADVKACEGDLERDGAAVIAVPAPSLIVHRPQVVTTFKAGVTAAQQPIVPVDPGRHDHGFAIDLGTTTVALALVELATGRIVAEASAFNRQIEFGDDVVTRIQLAGSATTRETLRDAVVSRTIAPLAAAACARAGIAPTRIAAATVAGNTTMLHLLTGTDPTSLGVAPFTAGFLHQRRITACDLGLAVVAPETPFHLLPGFSSYVGADLVAGALCSGLLSEPGPALLVDIGTNGEILLWHDGKLSAAATAAGPAFEGGRLSSGTRAAAGAVAHVSFPPGAFSPNLEVIAGRNPTAGVCGSAYIDFLAQARARGLLNTYGRFDDAAWRALPPAYRTDERDGRGVHLRANDPSTLITEADLAQLLQAKAAIAAGLVALLQRAGLAAADIRRLYLAGGFGLHLDVYHAIGCGLLPGFRPEQIEVVGNTSLGGAWLALNDRTVLPEMTRISGTAEIVELNQLPAFEDTFIDQLALA